MRQDSISTTEMVFGSEAWLKVVYASGPSRDVNSKGRSTVRHFQVVDEAGEIDVLEGRLENAAGILLKVLRNWKYVRKFKSQPFEMIKQNHGVDAFPDFLVELVDGRRFVVEVKTMRWFNDAEKDQQEAVANAIHETQMKFVLWSDKYPFTNNTFHNLNHMRRANSLQYEESELEQVAEAIKEGPKLISELTNKDFIKFDQVLAAAYQGKVFLNLLLPISEKTYVHRNREDRILETLVAPWVRNLVGWNSLPGIALER
jgi:hypothetical protein